MKCLTCGSLLMDHGSPCAAEHGASDALPSDAGNPSTGEGFGSPHAPLQVTPINFDEANAFVKQFHRHHQPMPGCKFCIAVSIGEQVVGVCIVGRPVARLLDDGWTLEVNRTCTLGHKNANSMLYGAAWRAAKAMGYRRLITYTLPEEGGASLRAAGWKCLGEKGGGTWNRKGRPRVDKHPTQTKLLWEA